MGSQKDKKQIAKRIEKGFRIIEKKKSEDRSKVFRNGPQHCLDLLISHCHGKILHHKPAGLNSKVIKVIDRHLIVIDLIVRLHD